MKCRASQGDCAGDAWGHGCLPWGREGERGSQAASHMAANSAEQPSSAFSREELCDPAEPKAWVKHITVPITEVDAMISLCSGGAHKWKWGDTMVLLVLPPAIALAACILGPEAQPPICPRVYFAQE